MNTEDIQRLARADKLAAFYKSKEWRRLRAEVMNDYKSECQTCKERGLYKRAKIVHHVNHVKDRPDLALSKYYTDKQGRKQKQLVPLCNDCHEEVHGHRHEEKVPLTEERW